MNFSKTIPTSMIAIVFIVGCKQEKDVEAPADFEPVKPVFQMKIDSPHEDPTVKNAGKPDPVGEKIRQRSLKVLAAGGFHPAKGLPTAGHRAGAAGKLRPIREVALRLMALNALFAWVTAPESSVPNGQLIAYVNKNGLRAHLTEKERTILALARPEAQKLYRSAIGWRLENMWALAWILGFDPPPDPTSGQVPNKISRGVVLEFLPGFDSSVEDLLKAARPRSEQAVVELEDVFYCAHNAVRSAQAGSKTTVPRNFHPIRDGGAIHERRHSLTWAISPGVAWEATDLST